MIFDNHTYLMVLLKRVYLLLIGIIVFFLFLSLFFASRWYAAVKEVKQVQRQVYILDNGQAWSAKAYNMTIPDRKKEIEAFTKWFLEKSFAHDKHSVHSNLREVMEVIGNEENAKVIYFLNPRQEKERYANENAISKVRIKEIKVEQEDDQNSVPGYWEVSVKFYRDLHYRDIEESEDRRETKACWLFLAVQDISRAPSNPWGIGIKEIKEIEPDFN